MGRHTRHFLVAADFHPQVGRMVPPELVRSDREMCESGEAITCLCGSRGACTG